MIAGLDANVTFSLLVYLDNPGAVNKLLVKELDAATASSSKVTLTMQ
jgi:hypothetical protein